MICGLGGGLEARVLAERDTLLVVARKVDELQIVLAMSSELAGQRRSRSGGVS